MERRRTHGGDFGVCLGGSHKQSDLETVIFRGIWFLLARVPKCFSRELFCAPLFSW